LKKKKALPKVHEISLCGAGEGVSRTSFKWAVSLKREKKKGGKSALELMGGERTLGALMVSSSICRNEQKNTRQQTKKSKRKRRREF